MRNQNDEGAKRDDLNEIADVLGQAFSKMSDLHPKTDFGRDLKGELTELLSEVLISIKDHTQEQTP